MLAFSNIRILSLLMTTTLILSIECILGTMFYRSIQSRNKAEVNLNKVDFFLRSNGLHISEAETSLRGYLITSDSNYLKNYEMNVDEIQQDYLVLDSFNSTLSIPLLRDLKVIAMNKTKNMAVIHALYKSNQRDSAFVMVKSNARRHTIDSIRNIGTRVRAAIAKEIIEAKQKETTFYSAFLLVTFLLFCFNVFVTTYAYSMLTKNSNRLNATISSLRDANTVLNEYTSMSYHELRTPLRNIGGFAQILNSRLKEKLTNEESEFLRFIVDGVKQMNDTINKMRDKYLSDHDDKKPFKITKP